MSYFSVHQDGGIEAENAPVFGVFGAGGALLESAGEDEGWIPVKRDAHRGGKDAVLSRMDPKSSEHEKKEKGEEKAKVESEHVELPWASRERMRWAEFNNQRPLAVDLTELSPVSGSAEDSEQMDQEVWDWQPSRHVESTETRVSEVGRGGVDRGAKWKDRSVKAGSSHVVVLCDDEEDLEVYPGRLSPSNSTLQPPSPSLRHRSKRRWHVSPVPEAGGGWGGWGSDLTLRVRADEDSDDVVCLDSPKLTANDTGAVSRGKASRRERRRRHRREEVGQNSKLSDRDGRLSDVVFVPAPEAQQAAEQVENSDNRAQMDRFLVSSTVKSVFTCPICFDELEKVLSVPCGVVNPASVRETCHVPKRPGSIFCMLFDLPSAVQGTSVCYFGCGHRLCLDCASTFVSSKVKEGQVTPEVLKCPLFKCTWALTAQEVRGCLAEDHETLEKFEGFTIKRYLEGHRESTFLCPTPGCDFAAELAEGGSVGAFKCPTCRKSFCLVCKALWHEGISCEDNAALQEAPKEDQAFLKLARKTMKQCPKCRMWVQKSQGCNAMLCRCGVTFCWRCGGNVNNHKGCSCMAKLDELSRRDREDVLEVNAHATNRNNPAHRELTRMYANQMGAPQQGGHMPWQMEDTLANIGAYLPVLRGRVRRDAGRGAEGGNWGRRAGGWRQGGTGEDGAGGAGWVAFQGFGYRMGGGR